MTMDKTRRFKIIAIFILILAVIGLSIAYAAMSEILSITGTAKMNSANWRIKFSNLIASKTGDAYFTLPALSDTSLLDFEVNFVKPKDSVTFMFDVNNLGNIDAVLGTLSYGKIECTGNDNDIKIVCDNIVYSLKYSDGTEVKIGDYLNKGETKTLKLSLSYEGESLPDDDVTISGLDINMIFEEN